jgi:curved DNA-binding protein CbpA
MDRRDFDQIEKFLGIVGKPSLFEYYAVDPDADPATVEEALKKKRGWAQGQQGNPKFRAEALWIIKNMALVRKALVDERQDYLKEVRSKDASRNLEILTLFIKGALADGHLTAKKEDAIRHQGRELGLDEDVVAAQVETTMAELGATRGGEDEATEDAPLVDYYAALEVARDADPEELERAYRARYRWARNLRDVKKASEVYAQLDEAWRILKDPQKRELYNTRLEVQLSEQPTEDSPGSPAAASTSEDTESDISIIPGAPPARSRGASLDGSIQHPAAQTSRVLGFQEEPTRSGPNESIPPVRQAPRPPDRIGGRTLGLGKDGRPGVQKSPRLQIDGAEAQRVVAWRSPVTVRFVVRNAGSGTMSGRVFSDRDWVQVKPSRLDPDVQRQTIEVTVNPKGMPRSKAVSLVTVVADHGERKVLTVETQRQLIPGGSKTVFAVGGLLLVALLVTGVLWAVRPVPPLVEAAGPPTRLVVTVDPPVGQIFVGEGCNSLTPQKECRQVSDDGHYDGQLGFPIDKPFYVRAQYWGFAPVTKLVTAKAHTETNVDIQLELDATLPAWTPPQNAIAGKVPREELQRVFGAFQPNLDQCLTAAGMPKGKSFDITAEGAIRAEGQVYDVRLVRVSPPFPTSVDPYDCLQRTLRALPFAKLDSDAYATFRHDFRLQTGAS